MIGTITLNPSIDQNWIVPDLVKDDTNRAKTMIETPGGKGVNVSKVVRELGGKTRAYALLGGWTGQHLERLVRPLDFPLVSVRIHGNTRVNAVLTDLKDDTQTRVSAPGPRVRAGELEGFIRLLCRVRPRPDWWVFGGSLPRDLAPSTYRELIRTLQQKGTPCVLDTDNEALEQGVRAKPFMIKPNEFEMQRLCGRRLRRLEDHAREAARLAKNGIRLVVVSLAERGALFVTADRAFHVAAPKVRVRSQVGAGDSLIGGILCGLERKMPLQRAARLGVASSTSCVMREAPRLCRRADIPRILERLNVREL